MPSKQELKSLYIKFGIGMLAFMGVASTIGYLVLVPLVKEG
ncbi:MAG: hypothetical protein QF527_04190 [SAR86 cluster bacterium]|nr:hypothetical protein [SAR86 cluster bacterium]